MNLYEGSVHARELVLTEQGRSHSAQVYHLQRVVYILRGSADWTVGGQRLQPGEGDILLLGYRTVRILERIHKTGELSLIALDFEPRFLLSEGLMELFDLNNGQSALFRPRTGEFERLFLSIHAEITRGGAYHDTLVRLAAFEILVRIARERSFSRRADTTREALKTVLEYIDGHYREHVPLRALAAAAYMSEGALTRMFGAAMGISPVGYIRKKRMSHALHLIRTTEMPISQIALESGFSSLSNFYKAFSDMLGRTPRELRAEAREDQPV